MSTATTAEIARELGLTDRRVRQLADEGTFRRLHDGRFDAPECRRAYRIFSSRDPHEVDRLYYEVEDLAEAVDKGLRDLEARPLAERQSAAGALGRLIGDLSAKLELVASLQREGATRAFHRQIVRGLYGAAVGRFFNLLGLEVEGAAPPGG